MRSRQSPSKRPRVDVDTAKKQLEMIWTYKFLRLLYMKDNVFQPAAAIQKAAIEILKQASWSHFHPSYGMINVLLRGTPHVQRILFPQGGHVRGNPFLRKGSEQVRWEEYQWYPPDWRVKRDKILKTQQSASKKKCVSKELHKCIIYVFHISCMSLILIVPSDFNIFGRFLYFVNISLKCNFLIRTENKQNCCFKNSVVCFINKISRFYFDWFQAPLKRRICYSNVLDNLDSSFDQHNLESKQNQLNY
jgi:hypothetical protein